MGSREASDSSEGGLDSSCTPIAPPFAAQQTQHIFFILKHGAETKSNHGYGDLFHLTIPTTQRPWGTPVPLPHPWIHDTTQMARDLYKIMYPSMWTGQKKEEVMWPMDSCTQYGCTALVNGCQQLARPLPGGHSLQSFSSGCGNA